MAEREDKQMFDEDSFTAPAFVIPHVAFQSFFGVPWSVGMTEVLGRWPDQWRQYPTVPLIFPGTTLHLRLVRMVDEARIPRRDYLSFVIQGGNSGVTRCQADRVAAAVLAVMAAAKITLVDPRDYVPIPVPPELWPAHTLTIPVLLATLNIQEGSGLGLDRHPMWRSLYERSQIGLDWPLATRALVRFFDDPRLLRGAMYFAASIGVLCFLGDDVTGILGERDQGPSTILAQTDAETAIWLAYKAVEAIIGHLPSNRAKLEKRLAEEGFSDFKAGWRSEPAIVLAEKLVTFAWDRDKRAGHGSMNQHRRRAITYFQVMDYQCLVAALLEHRSLGQEAERTLGEKITS